uniref:RING-type E3 ubiquitin transferase n=1 Tax=Oryza punctata TaxID=4537 RepID=A0A0E0JXZ5_ORYPU
MSGVAAARRSAARVAGGGSGGDDDYECRACYGVSVACVSLLLFCVLAASVSVTKACAVAGLAVLLFGVIGWFVPLCGAGGPPPARAAADAAGARRATRCACRLVGAALIATLPAFVYEGPAEGGGGGGGSKHGGSVLCAVCLEDVVRGETVRRLPACGHLFHRDCVDMWLHSHTTCPLCRCEVLPRRPATKPAPPPAEAAPAAESTSAYADADALPPCHRPNLRPSAANTSGQNLKTNHAAGPTPMPRRAHPARHERVFLATESAAPLAQYVLARLLRARDSAEGLQMFNGERRPATSHRGGGDGGYLACYSVVMVCASLLLLSVLAATVSIAKACVFAAAAAVLFGAIGCVSRWCGDAGGAPALPTTTAAEARAPAAVCATCGLVGAAIDALPAFAYARPAADGGGGGGGSKSGRCALCSVCLEDVQAGEMVRQLPACRHLFHVDCIDMWLHSHSTCPLCRCNVSPPATTVVKATATSTATAEAAQQPADTLPPVALYKIVA